METVGNLRIILAPSVLIGALLLGSALDDSLLCELERLEKRGVLTVLAGIVAASVIPLGFILGKLTELFLLAFARLCCIGHHGRYDLLVGDLVLRQICERLGIEIPGDGSGRLNAVRTYVYSKRWVPPEIAKYIDRLWAASMAYGQSILALVIAIVLARCLKLPYLSSDLWLWLLTGFGVIFFLGWFSPRCEIEKVITSAANHPLPGQRPEATGAAPEFSP